MISEEVNKAFGRFIDLAMINIGGYYVKENRMGTFGYLFPWTFSEDEDACLEVGWEPYHVTQGYDLDSNTITAGSSLTWGNNLTPSTTNHEEILKVIAFDVTEKQQNALGNTNAQVYRTIFITKPIAELLSQTYSTKEELEDALIKTAKRPLWMRAYALYYANTGSQQNNIPLDQYYTNLQANEDEKAALINTPDWLKGFVNDEKIWTITTMNKGETKIIVTGDDVRNKVQIMPGGGYATVEIHLPDNWDTLIAPMGYQPLSTFYLSDKYNPDEKVDLKTPNGFPDGTYMLVSSKKQVASGKIYFSYDTIKILENEVEKTYQLDINANDKSLAKLLSSLAAPCSIIIENNIINNIIIRPCASSAGNPQTDISSLKFSSYGTAEIIFSINVKRSSIGGGVTLNGTTVIISSTIEQMKLDLGDNAEVIVDGDNSPDFVGYNNGILNINTKALGGSICKFKAKNDNGTFRTLTFTMKINKTISIEYESGE